MVSGKPLVLGLGIRTQDRCVYVSGVPITGQTYIPQCTSKKALVVSTRLYLQGMLKGSQWGC